MGFMKMIGYGVAAKQVLNGRVPKKFLVKRATKGFKHLVKNATRSSNSNNVVISSYTVNRITSNNTVVPVTVTHTPGRWVIN
jgi:hypothetical protein